MPGNLKDRALQSAQEFVRALKAPSDPPVAGGPTKIQIAQDAWSDTTFYVPSKSEVITDWILMKLLKVKSKDIFGNPVVDPQYWELLGSLVGANKSLNKTAESRPVNIWLIPLLNRVPLAPVVISFLNLYNGVTEDKIIGLSNATSLCLSTLWPLAAQKMNTETLQECFGALLAVLSSLIFPNDAIIKIGSLLTTSYQNSLTNSSNKKKLYQTFLQSHLLNWIRSLTTDPVQYGQPLVNIAADAGIETLFNLDILRQQNDTTVEHPLLEHLHGHLVTHRTVVLKILPRICSSYIVSIKRHKGALFSQGSQSQPGAALEGFQEAGLRFFISLLNLVDFSSQDNLAWQIRLSLLKIVDQENLFNRIQVEAQISFNQILEIAIVALNDGWEEGHLECNGLATQCLTTIASIDYDLMLPFMSRLLPLFLQIPLPREEHFSFLDILLSYHTKTRTLDILVQNLFTSISTSTSYPKGPQEQYQLLFSSPPMHDFFLGRLSKALQKFLTESQCLQTIQLVFNVTKMAWNAFYNKEPSEKSPRKRRKLDSGSTGEMAAIVYCLICRLASVVLSSLPMASMSSENVINVRQALEDFRRGPLRHSISKSLKDVKKQDAKGLWSAEVTTVAGLRLLYALNVSRNLSLPRTHDEKIIGKVSSLLDIETLPELTLELYRTLLYAMSISNETDPKNVFFHLLAYLDQNFTPTGVRWSGHTQHLTKSELGRAESAIALVHIVVERWLPVVDRFAAPDQIEKLVKLFLSIKTEPTISIPHQLQPEQLLMQLLRSAQFWELHAIRNVFSAFLLSSISAQQQAPSELFHASAMYRYLLFFPMEYFTSECLNWLMKQAMAIDFALSKPSHLSSELARILTASRNFLKRAHVHIGFGEQDHIQESSEFLVHLLNSNPGDGELTKATLDLVVLYFSKLLKSSKRNAPTPLLEVLNTLSPSSNFITTSQSMHSLAFTALISLLERDFPSSSLPEDVVSSLRKIQRDISVTVLPKIDALATQNIPQGNIKESARLVSEWSSLLSLHKWIQVQATVQAATPARTIPLVAHLLPMLRTGNYSRSADLDDFCVGLFGVLLKELEVCASDEDEKEERKRRSHLEVMMAVYIFFGGIFDESNRQRIDAHLGKFCKKVNVRDYVYMTTFIADSLSSGVEALLSEHLTHLVHLASLILHEHPTHTLTHTQTLLSRLLSIFNQDAIFACGPGPVELRMQVLQLLERHCMDVHMSMALRARDVGGIMLLLGKLLSPPPKPSDSEGLTHDAHTTPSFFHHTTSILSSLVRARRDLVAQHLPHLALLLRRLVISLRTCRTNLGQTQRKMVQGTLPRWVCTEEPLGVEEAKALSRLLEGLLTKTTVKSLLSANDGGEGKSKAASLASPLSKHAPSILHAYIVSLTSALSSLPSGDAHYAPNRHLALW